MPATLDDVVTVLKTSNQNMSQLITTVESVLSRSFGTFTMDASATKVVADTTIASSSVVLLMPTNAAAGTLQGSTKCLYVSTLTDGASFTVETASGVAAVGTETFSYCVFNPL